MNVFELFASISLDTKPFQNGLSNAASMASSAGSKVAGGLATIGKMGAAAVGAASAAMTRPEPAIKASPEEIRAADAKYQRYIALSRAMSAFYHE